MFKIKVTDEQISYVQDLLEKVNFGQRGDGTKRYNNGTKEEQFVGILGEVVVADLFGQKRPGEKKIKGRKGDEGIDLIIYNQKIDVKTMSRHCDVQDYYVHNLHGDQVGSYYKNNIYLFTSLNKTNMELTICGWVTKEEFFKRADFYPCGAIRENPQKKFRVRSKKGMYEICNGKLNPFYNKKQFCQEMKKLFYKTYQLKNTITKIANYN